MGDERRRFFRVDDRLGVSYRVLTEEELQTELNAEDKPADPLNLMIGYDKTIEGILSTLKLKDPEVAGLVNALNKKLNCIVNQLEIESRIVERMAHTIKAVNISACGMAFIADEELSVSQKLGLDLILYPANLQLSSYATVVYCEPADDDGYYVRVNFHGMTVADQELLIQHIVKRQGSVLRELRNSDAEKEEPRIS